MWVDPWSEADLSGLPKASLILVTDVHADHFDPKAIEAVSDAETIVIAPQVVADKVVKAATDKKPKLRYPAGKQTRQVSVLLRFGPERLVAKILRKGNGLPA